MLALAAELEADNDAGCPLGNDVLLSSNLEAPAIVGAQAIAILAVALSLGGDFGVAEYRPRTRTRNSEGPAHRRALGLFVGPEAQAAIAGP